MSTQVRTYCSLCGVGCPVTVTADGQHVRALEVDGLHPRGGILCAKGRAVPEIHDHPHRVNHPLRRTNPKTADDPGWEKCSWDEALDLIATALRRFREESGPHSVAIGRGTGSGTGLKPTEPWVQRLSTAFGTPNYLTTTHLCNWPRDGAAHYTFGTYPLPPPDVEHSNCIVIWGANPSATVLDLATAITAARKRGARLIVVDPRRVGLASRADVLLQVRPGTDGALALALIHELIEHRLYDEEFVRTWTNAAFLVRQDTGRILRLTDITPAERPSTSLSDAVVAERSGRLACYDPTSIDSPVLIGSVDVELRDGRTVRCRPVFDLLAETASRYEAEATGRITGVPERLIRETARLLAENRPVSLHAWNGIVQHSNATQTGRAIAVLYALLGDWDRPGGNVMPAPTFTTDITGSSLLPPEKHALRLGSTDRPLGPAAARPGNIAAVDLYTAVLDADPYQVRGLVSFGGNTLISNGDPLRGREAFRRLEFFAQADLFHTPTNALADVLLPAASFLESEHLAIVGGRAERRRRSVEPLYERRPDIDIIFDLAHRLELDDAFAGGDVAAAFDEVLAPAGVSWDGLLDHHDGVDVAPPVQHEKHAVLDGEGTPRGFATPSGTVELFVERFAEHDQPAVPEYTQPAWSHEATDDYPLLLTNAKLPRYLHSQHRGIAALRRANPDPTVELHPETAARYGITDGCWIAVETPRARIRAKAQFTTRIVPGVACANHGWWERCEELGLDPGDPFSEQGTNVNLLTDNTVRDPISGSVPHRSMRCRLRRIEEAS